MRITVTRPAATPLTHSLVAGLQAQGHEILFYTGFYYKPRLAGLVGMLPPRLRARLERDFGRRFHPGIDPRTVRLCHWHIELTRAMSDRAGVPPRMQNTLERLHHSGLDRAAARGILTDRPEIVIAHDNSARRTFEAARAIGGKTVLNQVTGHRSAGLRLLREERELWPDFADSMPVRPQIAKWAPDEAESLAADRILVPSTYVSGTLQELGIPEKRVVLLPYGVDVARFRPQNKPRRPFRLLFVGRIGQGKGIRYLLEAYRKLELKEAELILVGGVIGSGAGLAPYRDLFTHVHNVPYAEVHRYFSSASVFVYPSLHEGSALAIYEALASGLPVITTPNAGSVVRDGTDGYIVPIRDTAALMDRIQRLYDDDSLRQTMALNARARAEEYSWDKYSDDLQGILKSLVAQPDVGSSPSGNPCPADVMMAAAPA